jgi:CRISPR system Cascade subunit CasA
MTGKPSFDLRERPWIPVRMDGERRSVGLRELFIRAHKLTDVELPLSPVLDVELPLPPAAAGLWRVLYLIAGRVSGLDDPDLGVRDFEDRRDDLLDSGRFDEEKIEEYFDRFGSRFDLFDETRPWLQDPRLAEQCSAGSGVNKLVFGRPAGSNQVWFSHHTDLDVAPVPAAEAAWHLIGNLYYGPSGRCTTRTVGSLSEANTTAGPLRGSLSCHPVGTTLFESIVSGIPRLSSDDGQNMSRAIDEAPWEAADLPDPSAPPPSLAGLSRLLVGRFQHAILLTPDASGEAAFRHRTEGGEAGEGHDRFVGGAGPAGCTAAQPRAPVGPSGGPAGAPLRRSVPARPSRPRPGKGGRRHPTRRRCDREGLLHGRRVDRRPAPHRP